jgi:hypothetical protein
VNRGRPPLMLLLLPVRGGVCRPGVSIPSAAVGATRVPVAFSLLIEDADGRRFERKDGMNLDFFFSGSSAGAGTGAGAGAGAGADGDSACATGAVLAMIVAAGGGGGW